MNALLPYARFWPGTQLLVKALYRAQKLLGRHRYDRFRMERIAGTPILVMPSVFNPKRLRTGAFFASCLDAALIGEPTTVLDLGTGSGICAVFAARRARHVVAVDINPAAVRCAQVNALLNHLERWIEVRHGDLFEAVEGQRFDRVLFNPPFLRGAPADDRDRAWRSQDVAERFAAGLRGHLTPRGFALVLLSTFGESGRFLDELRARRYGIRVFAGRKYLGEYLTIYKVTSWTAEEGA